MHLMNPIKQRREANVLTPSQLARHVSVSSYAVRQWERGAMPSAQNLRQLAKVLNVDYLDLASELLYWRNAAR